MFATNQGNRPNQSKFTAEVGDLLVLTIKNTVGNYIGEIIQTSPLRIKVEEQGDFADLQEGDYVVQEALSARLQADARKNTVALIAEMAADSHPLMSGLKRLNVADGRLHDILPPDANRDALKDSLMFETGLDRTVLGYGNVLPGSDDLEIRCVCRTLTKLGVPFTKIKTMDGGAIIMVPRAQIPKLPVYEGEPFLPADTNFENGGYKLVAIRRCFVDVMTQKR